MKSALRLLAFVLAFYVEVHVKADIIQTPTHCISKTETCSLKSLKDGDDLSSPVTHFHLKHGAVLTRNQPHDWALKKGTIWVEKGQGLRLQTLHAEIKSEFGEFWIIEKEDKIWVRNLSAELTVVLRDGRKLQPPAGFEFWVSAVNTEGRSDYGMITPIQLSEHIPLWWSLFKGSKSEFKKQVALYKANWGDLVEKSSLIYKDDAQRKLASLDEQSNAVEAARLAKIRKEKMQKRMYQEKVFEH